MAEVSAVGSGGRLMNHALYPHRFMGYTHEHREGKITLVGLMCFMSCADHLVTKHYRNVREQSAEWTPPINDFLTPVGCSSGMPLTRQENLINSNISCSPRINASAPAVLASDLPAYHLLFIAARQFLYNTVCARSDGASGEDFH